MSALKAFPVLSECLLSESDDIDVRVEAEEKKLIDAGLDEDSSDEIEDVLAEDAPENEWAMVKQSDGAVSPAVDSIMALTGLTEIKRKTISVYKKVRLEPFRPKDLQHQTTMNFLFSGNPGCGKVHT